MSVAQQYEVIENKFIDLWLQSGIPEVYKNRFETESGINYDAIMSIIEKINKNTLTFKRSLTANDG